MDMFPTRATTKAVESAIQSRQWLKAIQILEIQDSSMSAKYYKQIADHYASIGEYEVRIFDLYSLHWGI
jgi:intraflagellar transport protein 172